VACSKLGVRCVTLEQMLKDEEDRPVVDQFEIRLDSLHLAPFEYDHLFYEPRGSRGERLAVGRYLIGDQGDVLVPFLSDECKNVRAYPVRHVHHPVVSVPAVSVPSARSVSRSCIVSPLGMTTELASVMTLPVTLIVMSAPLRGNLGSSLDCDKSADQLPTNGLLAACWSCWVANTNAPAMLRIVASSTVVTNPLQRLRHRRAALGPGRFQLTQYPVPTEKLKREGTLPFRSLQRGCESSPTPDQCSNDR